MANCKEITREQAGLDTEIRDCYFRNFHLLFVACYTTLLVPRFRIPRIRGEAKEYFDTLQVRR